MLVVMAHQDFEGRLQEITACKPEAENFPFFSFPLVSSVELDLCLYSQSIE